MANAIADAPKLLKTFDSKSRVTFNSADIIELDSLDYPPPSPSDKGVRVTFAEEDDDENGDSDNVIDSEVLYIVVICFVFIPSTFPIATFTFPFTLTHSQASQRNTFSYHIGARDGADRRPPHVTAIVNISSAPLPPPTSLTPSPPPPPPPHVASTLAAPACNRFRTLCCNR